MPLYLADLTADECMQAKNHKIIFLSKYESQY